jgi:hypothetical protein
MCLRSEWLVYIFNEWSVLVRSRGLLEEHGLDRNWRAVRAGICSATMWASWVALRSASIVWRLGTCWHACLFQADGTEASSRRFQIRHGPITAESSMCLPFVSVVITRRGTMLHEVCRPFTILILFRAQLHVLFDKPYAMGIS